MINLRTGFRALLVGATLVAAVPAAEASHGRRHRGDVGAAIAALAVGAAVGAALASRRDRARDIEEAPVIDAQYAPYGYEQPRYRRGGWVYDPYTGQWVDRRAWRPTYDSPQPRYGNPYAPRYDRRWGRRYYAPGPTDQPGHPEGSPAR